MTVLFLVLLYLFYSGKAILWGLRSNWRNLFAGFAFGSKTLWSWFFSTFSLFSSSDIFYRGNILSLELLSICPMPKWGCNSWWLNSPCRLEFRSWYAQEVEVSTLPKIKWVTLTFISLTCSGLIWFIVYTFNIVWQMAKKRPLFLSWLRNGKNKRFLLPSYGSN